MAQNRRILGRTLLTGGGSDLQRPLQRRRPRQRLRPRLLRLNGNLVASTTIAAAQRRLGGYDHGNGYDHDCCGSTTAAITTLTMVTIAAAMATIAEPMGVLERPSPPPGRLLAMARGLGASPLHALANPPLPPGDASPPPPKRQSLVVVISYGS